MKKQLDTPEILVYNLVSSKNGILDFLKDKETSPEDMKHLMALLHINNLESVLELGSNSFQLPA